jgi:hypothetical protein
VASEDVEDELGAVDDVAGEPGLDVAELRGREVMIEENKWRVGGGYDLNNFVELALADEAGGIGLLTPLDEGCGDGCTGWTGEFLELCTAGIEVEGGGCLDREVFFSSHDSGRGAGESSGCGKLSALAKFSGELDHDNHGKFLLSLRGTKFPGE